jgi:hypothetical protein
MVGLMGRPMGDDDGEGLVQRLCLQRSKRDRGSECNPTFKVLHMESESHPIREDYLDKAYR